MDWYATVFEIIEMRSFSNLWYWIGLAVLWSTASHWVIGVPFDMVLQARRHGGQAETDLEDMVRIMCNRLLYITGLLGLFILAFACAVNTMLFMLGFFYGNEFSQALFFFVFPMSFLFLLSSHTARVITREKAKGALMHKRLARHRLYTQMTGVLFVFVTAMWGMYQNIAVGPLGG